MKHLKLSFLLTLLMSMVGIEASAHDIEVKNSDGVTIYYNFINNMELEVTFRGSSYSSYSNEYTGDVKIPSSVTYDGKTYNVVVIGYGALADCYQLSNITIPNSVNIIDNKAFYNCSRLTSIKLPNSVTSIGYSAFSSCI